MLSARELPESGNHKGDISSTVPRLLLSGSRGFGGICSESPSGLMSVDIFDLEEDDEEEGEDDDEAADK